MRIEIGCLVDSIEILRRALCFPTPRRIKVQEIFCKSYIKILRINKDIICNVF